MTKKRKRSKSNRGRLRQLANKIKKTAFGKEAHVVYEPAGELKMSDAIDDLIAPYSESANDLKQYRTLIGLAVIAWNATLVPPDAQAKALELVNTLDLPKDIQADMNSLLQALMARKLLLFPDVKRFIINYEVTPMKDGFHLSIASTLEPTS